METAKRRQAKTALALSQSLFSSSLRKVGQKSPPMSFFCLLQELYKIAVKGQQPGGTVQAELPGALGKTFNSSTIQGRANVARATLGLTAVVAVAAVTLVSRGRGSAVTAAPSSAASDPAAPAQLD